MKQMNHKHEVTVVIPTKDRYYTTLPMAIMSVAQQTYKPKKIFIFDDGEQKDLRKDPVYSNIFALLQLKEIELEVIFGKRRGQAFSHQMSIELSKTDWIYRVDDDDVLESQSLEYLISNIKENVGAVGGLILSPTDVRPLSPFASNKIEHIYYRPNIQWFAFNGIKEVDHLNNSFLYNREVAQKIGGYNLNLSPVGHREETLFSYSIKRAGYNVLVDPRSITWHMRDPKGGIRSYENQFLWEHDERIFASKLQEWKIESKKHKIVVLDCGLGDHYAFKAMLPELKDKYKNHDLILSVCYPEVFEDEKDIELISISDAKNVGINMDSHNIYRFMIDKDWKKSLTDAYREMLL